VKKPTQKPLPYYLLKKSLKPLPYCMFRERRLREKRDAEKLGTCGNTNAKEWMRQVVASEIKEINRAKRVIHCSY
jgi:hypothetical protein